MSEWNPEAFDRWLTTQPEDSECPVCEAPLGETEDCSECQKYRNYQEGAEE